MANRKTCLVCRDPERFLWWMLPHGYRLLCPEHKRLRNRLRRDHARRIRETLDWFARAAGGGDT